MSTVITDMHNQLWGHVARTLTPTSARPVAESLLRYTLLVAEVPIGVCLTVIEIVNQFTLSLFDYFNLNTDADPNDDFTVVLKDSRQWDRIADISVADGFRYEDFRFGVATCTYQDSGADRCTDSQWVSWEESVVEATNRSGKSASLFDKYVTEAGRKEMIDKLQLLGVNAYRFSVEWSLVEPEKGVIDHDTLAVYVDFAKSLKDAGIEPMVTLHHFSEPTWFHDEGSFENHDNIPCFTAFTHLVCEALSTDYEGAPLVNQYCTINEPGVEAFSRYIRGAFSPGCIMNFSRAMQFLSGTLKAHRAAYDVIKGFDPLISVGIVHQYLTLKAANPLLGPVTETLTQLANDTILNYFRTGVLKFEMPFYSFEDTTLPDPVTDFVGVQYYTRALIGLAGPTTRYSPMTTMPFHEDPEGLYEAITECFTAFDAPVIVTENGISTHDERQRERYMRRALYAAKKAENVIGSANFQGYFAWSFCDNFEWDMGMRPQAFGLFTSSLEMKEGARAYQEIIEEWSKAREQKPVPVLV